MRAAIVAIVLTASTAAAAQPVDDNKLWSTATGSADLTDRFRLSASEELRGGSTSGFDQARTEVALGFRPNDYLGFAAVYVLMVCDGDPRLGTVDETRHRVAGDASVRYAFGRFGIANRLRLQYTTHPADNAGRIEVRDRIRGGFDATDRVKPYVAVEALYLLDPKSEYRETRFYVGVDYRLTKRIELGAYFLRQVETNVSMPEHNNILGLEMTYLVRKVKRPKADDADHD